MTNSGVVSNIIKLFSVALVLQLAAGQSNSSRKVCPVTAHSSLVQCLENPTFTRIVVQEDYSIGSSFEKYASTPLPITRSEQQHTPKQELQEGADLHPDASAQASSTVLIVQQRSAAYTVALLLGHAG